MYLNFTDDLSLVSFVYAYFVFSSSFLSINRKCNIFYHTIRRKTLTGVLRKVQHLTDASPRIAFLDSHRRSSVFT